MQARPFAQLRLRSPEDTESLAQAIAPLLRAGDVLLLDGPIGAGKSHFCRALIQTRLRADGRYEDVPSPTFTLVQTYELADVDLWHCDLYRLTSVDEVLDLGLDEAFENAICLIEWPDRLENTAPETALQIALSWPQHATEHRDLTLSDKAGNWETRLAPVLAQVSA